ncbi:uncharacterized protein LOC132645382 isoform X4 [Lycium barbarum]|uniref:uncharacterized protein LOC132645382 isoform X4 n=1 Tax=Lycium barbarum TaxID=112863 RepID=UPI00293E1EA6|nr:uncharacterized protein LOC132645382 isoform X4 [Lycium barbarum]
MSNLACPWLCGAYAYPSKFCNFLSSKDTTTTIIYCSNSQFTPPGPGPGPGLSQNDLKFVLHDALDAFGVNTTHARGFRRSGATNQSEPRALYLHSVLTHRCGSASLLSLLYSEILKMLRLWGLLSFDIEVFFPHDSSSSPRGYCKQKTKESDQSHVMTAQSLLEEMLKDLKDAFWPFQLDHTKSPFLRAARAANCLESTNNSEESAFELASVKASLHRLERGVWTNVRFGDMRRALSACEHLILLQTDPKELRDYGVLLYHCGFYKEALQYLTLYKDRKESSGLIDNMEEEAAMENLMIRLNLILMEEGWSLPTENKGFLRNNSEPW